MIGHQLYPTPPEVAKRMLDKLPRDTWRRSPGLILEPHGGTGNLLQAMGLRMDPGFGDKYSERVTERCKERLLTCEIDPILSAGLRENGYRFMCPDFLGFKGRPDITVIVGNPPFDQGAKHLLHAWDILYEGWVVFLLNSETIRNAHTHERVLLLKIIEDNGGEVEHIGKVFLEAERRAGVDCCIVTLQKVRREKEDWFEGTEFQGMPRMEYGEGEEPMNMLARPGFIEARVDLFNATLRLFEKDFLPAYMRIHQYTATVASGLKGEGHKSPTSMILDSLASANPHISNSYKHKDPALVLGSFYDALARVAWNDLLDCTKLSSKLTSNVRKEFDRMREMQGGMAFTLENIQNLMLTLLGSELEMMKAVLLESFDNLTRHYKDNRESVEGWKTNDAYRVRQKFILGYVVDTAYHMLRNTDTLDDLDKALSAMMNDPMDNRYEKGDTTKASILRALGERSWPLKGESKWFKFVCYKKGSGHFTFKDTKVWEKFNYEVAMARGWLAPTSADHNHTGTKWAKPANLGDEVLPFNV